MIYMIRISRLRSWQMYLQNIILTCAPLPNSYGLTRNASCMVSPAPANGDSINTPGFSLLTDEISKIKSYLMANSISNDSFAYRYFKIEIVKRITFACDKFFCNQIHSVSHWRNKCYIGISVIPGQLILLNQT